MVAVARAEYTGAPPVGSKSGVDGATIPVRTASLWSAMRHGCSPKRQ